MPLTFLAVAGYWKAPVYVHVLCSVDGLRFKVLYKSIYDWVHCTLAVLGADPVPIYHLIL